MIKNRILLSEVAAKYSSAQNEREYKKAERENRLLENAEYKKIAQEYSQKNLDFFRAEYEEDFEKCKILKEQISVLKAKKHQFEIEIFEDESEKASCEICKDLGSVNGEKCHCFYEKLTDICYEQLGLKKPSLFSFDEDKLDKDETLAKLYEKLKKYAVNFEKQTKNVIFTGKTGAGKTCLAEATAKRISEKNAVVLFVSAIDLNNLFIENMYASPYVSKLNNEILETCDFLVIDDLGAERVLNKVTAENLYSIVSQRQSAELPYLITTNLTTGEIAERYGDRLFSRLTGRTNVIFSFEGKDLRKI